MPLNKYYSGDQIKEDKMGRAAWQEREMYTGFCWRNLRYHMEDYALMGG